MRLLREPLLHFLAIGALLFAGYQFLGRDTPEPESSTRIVLTTEDLHQISVSWLAQGRPAPTPEQMRSLVEARVQGEILYREALALGLDKDDTIVKRRLAQKMEFLFENVAELREPTREELVEFHAKHPERFALPARVTFRHLYFSPDTRGEKARGDAGEALAKLARQPSDSPAAAALGDPFMFRDYYGDRPADELTKEFGPAFAGALLATAPGAWRGPLESGYGWHLVFVDSVTPSRVPDFDAVKTEVKNEWIEARRVEIRRQAYEAMRARYEVLLPEDQARAPQ